MTMMGVTISLGKEGGNLRKKQGKGLRGASGGRRGEGRKKMGWVFWGSTKKT